jgi:hypothetical protein
MIHIIISYIKKLLYGEPYQPYTPIIDNTFIIIPKQPTLSSEHLNEIKNFEFKKNRHYYFKY